MSSSEGSSSPNSTSELEPKIVLKSLDGGEFIVKKSVLTNVMAIKDWVECANNGDVIPIINVNEATLSIVIDYLTQHAELPDGGIEITFYDEFFANGFTDEKMFDLIAAANYLDIKELLDLMIQKIENMNY